MKTILLLAAAAFILTPRASAQCAPEDSYCIHCGQSIDKGRAGWIVPLILHLEPGETRVELWDFTGCDFGILDFILYVQPPHNNQEKLLTVTATNLTTGAVGLNWGSAVNKYFAYADCSLIELTVTLSAEAKKPLDVQIQWTGTLGGGSHCQ